MLDQANYWVSITATAVDALLLGRVLQLKLQRVYLFITLACILALFFDGIDLWLWSDNDTRLRVLIYSRFLYGFVYPMVGWDVFEEMKPQIVKIRRMAMGKLVSGLIFATILGSLVAIFVAPSEGGFGLLATLGVVVWAGSATSTLAFLWTLRRALRSNGIERPNNTGVWMAFWQLMLLAEVLSCFTLLLIPLVKNQIADGVITLLFATYGIAVTGWCLFKL
ncbi:MAG: hypothetical protein JO211_06795, partial [Acidobacteriaceae bacterium]|nr:hypothetical protein [Acidobacteriaceae bacterium]